MKRNAYFWAGRYNGRSKTYDCLWCVCGKIYILLKNLIASSAVQLKSPLGIVYKKHLLRWYRESL